MDLGAKGTVSVPRGETSAGRHGTGGSGSGAGTGTGTSQNQNPSPNPIPTSVAAIKIPAKPKGGFDYIDARNDYPAEAKKLGIEGQIKVRLLVDASGKVTRATLLTHLGHGLDELALARAPKIEFAPARDDADRPVASVVVWTFTFTLPK